MSTRFRIGQASGFTVLAALPGGTWSPVAHGLFPDKASAETARARLESMRWYVREDQRPSYRVEPVYLDWSAITLPVGREHGSSAA